MSLPLLYPLAASLEFVYLYKVININKFSRKEILKKQKKTQHINVIYLIKNNKLWKQQHNKTCLKMNKIPEQKGRINPISHKKYHIK